jgi:hypothetical protein
MPYVSSAVRLSRASPEAVTQRKKARPQGICAEDDLEVSSNRAIGLNSVPCLATRGLDDKVCDLKGLVSLRHYALVDLYRLAVDHHIRQCG